ncbi:MAG: exodeoxyribonuclease V subunit gamma [Flavobacteriaceae bacterium]|jgi:exodeoxyribonuclease V gamma subunit|nr:exodeoxyribonuclease V subunit gamma [Flavobacteriaceae bacterium]
MFQSTLIQPLIKQLALILKHSKNSVFQPEYIVGANASTKSYIKEQLTTYNGVTANLKFTSWNNVLQIIFRLLKPSNFVFEYANTTTTTQYLYNALSETNFIAQFPEISNYYSKDKRKQYGLAKKINHLFEEYLRYQPQLFKQWQTTTYSPKSPTEQWQQALWKTYREMLQQANLYDSYTVLETIYNEMSINSDRLIYLGEKLPCIHFLHTAQTTTSEMQLLQAIRPYCTVYLYSHSVNHNSYNKGSLMQLWSNAAQSVQTDSTLQQIEHTASAHKSTDLYNLQQSLYKQTEPISYIGDHTIQIQGHYTPFREIEGLLNSLIEKYHTTTVHAKDIVVYCNDLSNYIPAIHYFFNQPKYAIPYCIFGEYNYHTDTPLQALSALLAYRVEIMDPEELLILLQYPCLNKKFRITDIELLRKWIKQANIRFQYEADQTQDLHYISWKNGLDRILLGSCIGQQEEYNNDLLLLDVAEGATMDQLITFRYFVEQLYNYKQETHTDKTIAQWILYTQELIEFFFIVEKEDELREFCKQLSDFYTNSPEVHDFETWQMMLQPLLQNSQESIPPTLGGITFMGLKQAQVIPSTFTAVLGMSYNTFPTTQQGISFDLLKDIEEYKVKSRKEYDKFTFLNLILQTTDTLYISYLSHHPKTNDELPPSILVEQLIAFINQKTPQQLTVVHHPLQRYSTLYNRQIDLISYTQNLTTIASEEIITSSLVPIDTPKEFIISMTRLTGFYIDSFKQFYNYTLGIYIEEEQDTLPTAEPFELAPVELWQIRNYFFQHHIHWYTISEKDKKHHLKLLKAQGLLPLNHLGEVSIDQAFSKYMPLYNTFFSLTGENAPIQTPYQYNYTVEDTIYYIEGMAPIKNKQYCITAYSTNTNRIILDWLFTSYILLKSHLCDTCILLFNKNKELKQKELTLEQLDNYFSQSEWDNLLHTFHKGIKEFTPFYLPYEINEYLTVDDYIESLTVEAYLSPYVAKELYKPYFLNNKELTTAMFENYKIMFNLINRI